MRVVRIKCFDMSFNSSTWTQREITQDFGLIYLDIVGWLIEERKNCIIIASEYQPSEKQFRHLQAIPRVCIQKVITLAEVKDV